MPELLSKKEVQHASVNLKFLRKSHISQLSRPNHFSHVGWIYSGFHYYSFSRVMFKGYFKGGRVAISNTINNYMENTFNLFRGIKIVYK